MEKQKYYRFGLDIGIGSVGWAVLECNENGENIELVKAGVRIFNVAETEKNESLAAARRIARSARRRNRRHKFRLERARQLIVSTGILTQVELDELYSIHTKKENIYEIRYNALEHKLTNAQFAKLLIHYLQRRGYNCKGRDQYKIDKLKEELQDCNNTTAKSQTDEQKSLRGIASNSKIVESKKYRTVGEMIYKDDKFVLSDVSVKDKKIFKARNSPNDYKFVMLREWIVDEIRCVFECQKKLNNGFATDEICQDYLKIFEGQRDYAQGPGGDSLYGVSGYNKRVSEYNKKVLQSDKPKISVLWDKRVGKCTFELDQDRAERSSYSFEKFRLYQDLNHIKILNMTDGTVKPLNQEQWDKLYEMAHTKVEFKYKDIRKKLNLNDEQKFSNLDYKDKKKKGDTTKPKDPEMTKFKGLPCYHKIASALKNSGKNMDDFKEFLDPIARILTKFKDSDDKLVEQELQKLVDSEQELKKLVEGSEIVLQLAQID
ncbi:MAG: type II CRISPR RNA-guided endonuclease Cas9, partial [Clostridiales bacterium]|nr:type II CRISPR RNA-guided endonuclease Cas9 [Clostridiales bacterium]